MNSESVTPAGKTLRMALSSHDPAGSGAIRHLVAMNAEDWRSLDAGTRAAADAFIPRPAVHGPHHSRDAYRRSGRTGLSMTAPTGRTSDPLITGAQAARRVGIDPATWRSYVSKGLAPKADYVDENAPPNRSNPRWFKSTVDRYIANRLGRGARTDLKG